MTYHYIYKTTCTITSKYYLGMHSTNNLEDGYLGSGTRLKRSIKKHGKSNHVKEIIEFCENREQLILKEIEIVNQDLMLDKLCMNLKPGGRGGLCSLEHKASFVSAGINNFNKSEDKRAANLLKVQKTEKYRKNMSKSRKEYFKHHDNSFKNKKHTEASKKLISDKMKTMGKGESNSQYGSCWITKDGFNKKIKKENLDAFMLEGWSKGRIILK